MIHNKPELNKDNEYEKFPIVVKAMTVQETKEYFLKRLYQMSLKFAGDSK